MDESQLEQAIGISSRQVTAGLEEALRQALEDMRRDRIVLGLSGGLDSAVVAALSRRVLPGERILALIMPDRETHPVNTADAVDLACQLGIKSRIIHLDRYLESANVHFPIPFIGYSLKSRLVKIFYRKMRRRTGETPFQTILKGGWDSSFSRYLNKGTANYRFKHRLRLTFLYQAAEEMNALAVGAANKTEFMTGFFVKFGIDHNADIMPLMNLYKSQVFQLASGLELPQRIIDKAPSPDMIPGITDEFAFELSYRELDMLLYALENEIRPEGSLSEKYRYVRSLVDYSHHMRHMIIPNLFDPA
mgnify:CR=1 FL=1